MLKDVRMRTTLFIWFLVNVGNQIFCLCKSRKILPIFSQNKIKGLYKGGVKGKPSKEVKIKICEKL